MMVRACCALLAGILLCSAVALAGGPIVSNVQLVQRTDGSALADITYDLVDDDSQSLAVAVHFSADGGANWDYPARHLSGDTGPGVQPGAGRHIVWNVGAIPQAQDMEQLKVRIVASDVGIVHAAHSPANVAIIDWSSINWSNQANIEKYSRADFCMVAAAGLWSDEFRDVPVVAQIKAVNPNTKILGYISAKSAQLSGEAASANAFWHEWFVRTRPYWVYTTTGDTAQDWPSNVLLNILEPACRIGMIETIVAFQRESANKLDGIMWDYFNTALWVYDGIPNISGDPDMDGNGIGHWSDPAEMIAFRSAQVELISALRDSLGEGFIQVFNGQRAYSDPAFAALADGLLYEIFPTLGFPQPNMKNSLNTSFANNLYNVRSWLRSANGGPWILFSNPWLNQYLDTSGQVTPIINGNVYRVVAMMMDGFAVWHALDASAFGYTYGWTNNEISIGSPLGPPVYDGNFIRRDFQYGRVEIEWKTGRYPDPFSYRIWALGELVEELAVPRHIP